MKIKKEGFYTLLVLPWATLIILLFLLPTTFLLSTSLSNGLKPIKETFTNLYTYRLLSFSISESLLSAFFSLLIAFPFSYIFSTYSFPFRSFTLSLSSLSFTIPSILVVLGFVMWYGNNGVLNRTLMKLLSLEEAPLKILYSYKAIILAHAYLNLPVAFSLIVNSWCLIGEKEEKVSQTLGKSSFVTFFTITLPKLKLTLISCFVTIFLFCFSSFTVVLILGGKPSYYTLEAEIYRRAHIEGNTVSSASLSLFTFILMSLMLLGTSGGKRVQIIKNNSKSLIKAKGKKLLICFLTLFILLLFILPPVLTILYRSFFTRDNTFSLISWKKISQKAPGMALSGLEAILNSLIIGLIAALLSSLSAEAICIHGVKTNTKVLITLSSLPLAIGSVTLGLGFSFISTLFINKNLFLSYILIIASHFIITLPFSVRSLLPGVKNLSQKISKASYTLGVSKIKTFFSVESPLLFPYKIKAFAFSFALSLGEVNATLTLSDGKVTTLPVLIYRLVNRYDYQAASSLACILLLEALLIFSLGEIGGNFVRIRNY